MSIQLLKKLVIELDHAEATTTQLKFYVRKELKFFNINEIELINHIQQFHLHVFGCYWCEITNPIDKFIEITLDEHHCNYLNTTELKENLAKLKQCF